MVLGRCRRRHEECAIPVATIMKTSTARNRRFRQRVTQLGYRRIEVTADVTTIERLRSVAKIRRIPTYEALRQAVRLLVQWHNASVSSRDRSMKLRQIPIRNFRSIKVGPGRYRFTFRRRHGSVGNPRIYPPFLSLASIASASDFSLEDSAAFPFTLP
jgi:hypothetical protein